MRLTATTKDSRWRQHWWTFNYNGLARTNLPRDGVDGYDEPEDPEQPGDPIFGDVREAA